MLLTKRSKLGNALLPMLPQDQTSGGRAKVDANDPKATSLLPRMDLKADRYCV
jgi:hypothetical protein